MAEQKTNTLTTNQERMKSLETAISGIEKQFGKGAVMRLGSSRHLQVEAISTGSLSSQTTARRTYIYGRK